jgi:hypothetical protein
MSAPQTPTREELFDRFRPRNLRRDAAGGAVMYDQRVHADGSAGLPDPVVRWQVLTRHLCGLCGDLLGEEVTFIGTPRQVRRQRFTTPGMHVDCARFALSAVPFFADGEPRRSRTGFVRGQELVLYTCPGYEVSRAGLLCMRWLPASRIETVPLIKAQAPSCIEPHTGWRSMAAVVAAAGGCPAHADMAITGCLEHVELLTPGERVRIAERSAKPEAPPASVSGPISNMRELFTPRNLRIEANGFPLTYDNAVKPDGDAEGPTDMRIERRMLKTKRCLVCADDLGSEVAFIGTTLAASSGWYPTPGMHVDCARFSFAVCPFMSRPDWLPGTHTLQHIRTPELVLVVSGSYRYSAWRWWKAMKLHGPFRRANFGSARIGPIVREERYPGRREMLAYLNEQGGCPAHREQALTGSRAHVASKP